MTLETSLGQMLTVVYALVGIPLTMLALKTIGEAIANGIQLFVLRIEKAFFKTRQVNRVRLKTFLATCALMILFLILGSLIEIYAEGWSFVKGIYAWFVVMSTIGFGDYIPFQDMDQNSESKDSLWVLIYFMAFFILAGLCVVSAVLTSLAQAADEMKSTSQAGSRLVKHIKGRKNRVLRSAMYEVNVAVECELGEHKDVTAFIKQTRRVRSNSI